MPETKLIWTKEDAALRITLPDSVKRIGFSIHPPETAVMDRPPYTVVVEHKESGKSTTIRFKNAAPFVYEIDNEYAQHHIRIRVEKPFRPTEHGSLDMRVLGVYLSGFTHTPTAE